MPTYTLQCVECNRTKDVIAKMKEVPEVLQDIKCEDCNVKMKQVHLEAPNVLVTQLSTYFPKKEVLDLDKFRE